MAMPAMMAGALVFILASGLTPAQGATRRATAKPKHRIVLVRHVKVKKSARAIKPVKTVNKNKPAAKPVTVSPQPAPVVTPAPMIGLPYQQTFVQNDPIVLTGDQVLEIANEHYILNNSITLKDRARVYIHNATFEQRNNSAGPSKLEADNASQVEIDQAEVHFAPWIQWLFNNNSRLTMNNVAMPLAEGDAKVYTELHDSSVATIIRAPFTGSINQEADATIDHAANAAITLDLNGGAMINEQFPETAVDYTFPTRGLDNNVYLHLHLTNSTVAQWGVVTYPTTDLTIHDTNNLAISFAMISPWFGYTANLDGLRPVYYPDKTVHLSQTTTTFWDRYMNIRLIRTKVASWSPVVGEDNTLVLTNSEIAEQAWNWGTAKLVLENSTTSLIRGRQNVQIVAKDSNIKGNVTAADNSQITLINTKVEGTTNTLNNGKVIVLPQ